MTNNCYVEVDNCIFNLDTSDAAIHFNDPYGATNKLIAHINNSKGSVLKLSGTTPCKFFGGGNSFTTITNNNNSENYLV